MTKQTGLLLLGALLVGCGGDPGQPGPTPTYTLSGQVLPPGNSAAQSESASGAQDASLDALWAAPRVPGEVLLRGVPGGALGAQSLSALSGVRVQAVEGTDLLLASTPGGEEDLAFARRLTEAGLQAQPNFVTRRWRRPTTPAFRARTGPAWWSGARPTTRTT